jgi:hypothetical protein
MCLSVNYVDSCSDILRRLIHCELHSSSLFLGLFIDLFQRTRSSFQVQKFIDFFQQAGKAKASGIISID